MKKNETFSDFLLKYKKMRIDFALPVSAAVLIWILSSLINVSGQAEAPQQEKPRVPWKSVLVILISQKPWQVKCTSGNEYIIYVYFLKRCNNWISFYAPWSADA